MTADRLTVHVYRGSTREGVYLFVPPDAALEALPSALLQLMGRLELVMELELYPGRALARESAETVMRNVREQGFHLQLPPAEEDGRTH